MVRARTLARGGVLREFFFRYRVAGDDRMLRIGAYGTVEGKTNLKKAREKARAYMELVRRGVDPKAHDEREIRATREAEEEAAQAGRLRDLIDVYVTHLRNTDKLSADDVDKTLERHVLKPYPELAERRANEIAPSDISRILAHMIAAGITRRTNIVRAFLRAAFAYGAKREHDPKYIAEAIVAGETDTARKRFGIVHNPVAVVPRQDEFDRAGDRVLSDEELRDYWKSLDGESVAIGGFLRAALLLGAQRMSQLKRATWGDYDAAERVLTLIERKGRDGKKKKHLLPISDWVATIIEQMREINPSGLIFSTSGGAVEISLETLSNAVRDIGVAFCKGETRPYTAKDLRRTAETRLVALGVSKEHRARLLSHGKKSDVQDFHYDRHGYLPENAATLAKWEAHLSQVLSGEAPKVIRGRFNRISQ